MMLIIFLAVLISAVQFSDTYLKYLPFRDSATDAERALLWRRLLIWGILSAVIYGAMFRHFGISAPLYKFLLMVCWMPWQAIFMLTVRRDFLQHIFILGMVAVWGLIQHNWAAIGCAVLFDTELEILPAHAIFYLALFLILLPVDRRIFLKLLPAQNFFDSYGRFIAVFPLILISSVLIISVRDRFDEAAVRAAADESEFAADGGTNHGAGRVQPAD